MTNSFIRHFNRIRRALVYRIDIYGPVSYDVKYIYVKTPEQTIDKFAKTERQYRDE